MRKRLRSWYAFGVDLNKIGAWASIIGCLFSAWSLLYPPAATQAVGATPPSLLIHPTMSTTLWVAISLLTLAGVLHITAAVIQHRGGSGMVLWNGPSMVPASGPRIIVAATPEELMQPFREEGRTTLDASVLTERYLNKWLRWSGPVRNVRPDAWVHSNVNKYQSISCSFDSEWNERVSMLRPGDIITVEGQIRSIDDSYVTILHCELLEVRRPVASPQSPTAPPSPPPPTSDS